MLHRNGLVVLVLLTCGGLLSPNHLALRVLLAPLLEARFLLPLLPAANGRSFDVRVDVRTLNGSLLPQAYYWLRHNTDPDAKIMSWWDYGYQVMRCRDTPQVFRRIVCTNQQSAVTWQW